MADISKIKLAGETTARNLKDKAARDNMDTLLGTGHSAGTAVLGAAAWEAVASAIDGTGLVSAAIAKAYVDAQVGSINKFDVVVAEELPTASANTMYKLYLIPNGSTGSNVKKEYITVRSGSEGSYTYAWELIGDTEVDLTGYVQKTTKIAGVDLADDITDTEMQTALGLKSLAYKDKGSVKVTTADSLTMNSYTPAGSVSVVLEDDSAVAATIATKAAYTPAGSVSLNAFTQTATDVESTGKFTPAGTIAAKTNGDFVALKSATFAKDASGVQIEGTNAASEVSITPSKDTFVKSLKAGTTAAASFTEGAFTAAAFQDGFVTAGSDASLSAGAQASLTAQTTAKFASEGLVASVGTGDDSETLIFGTASTADAVTDRGTFTANTLQTLSGGKATVIDTSKFSGGSKAADTFSAEKLPVVDGSAEAWTGYTAATAAAQVFTGEKYQNATTSDTALKEVAFTGTEGDVSVAGKYDKATANGASFTGTEAANLIPTSITYVPKKVKSADFTGTAATLTGTVNSTEKTIDVDFAVND